MRYRYLLKDPITKEIVWIGETSNPKQRYNSHCWGNRWDPKGKIEWAIGLKVIGLKPLFEIVDTAETKREALIKENNLIISYLKSGCRLFNLNNTKTIKQYDTNGKLICEFANGIIAKEITGICPRINRHTANGYQWSYGEFKPELFRAKEDAKKVLCKPVLQIDKSGKLIAEFEGVRIACKITGIDHRSISSVAAGNNPKRKSAGGFIWKYKEVANVA